MNYLAEALTGLDEDHDKRGSTIVEGENNMYYRLAQDEMIDKVKTKFEIDKYVNVMNNTLDKLNRKWETNGNLLLNL